VIELQGYSQNHFGTANFANDPTPVDREQVADANGSASFNDLRLVSNTRVRAHERGCAFTAGNIGSVINVRTTLTMNVSRNGPRVYTFSGSSIPARPGGLIVSLYRIVGTPCAAGVEPRNCPGEVLIGQARAQEGNLADGVVRAGDGTYTITKRFTLADNNRRVDFVLKTGQDAQNAPGRSNTRSLLIF